jgi:diadenosine tetraphosphate (Ap4A) HIT family hydrolase
VSESPEELYARAQAAAGPDGRLEPPPTGEWETFPFEGPLEVRPLLPPGEAERPRVGEGGVACPRCERGDDGAVWSDEHWILSPLPEPSGLPVVLILQPREHHDIADLPAERARELWPLAQRVEAAIRTVGEIGRVHVCRWGDGSEHLHLWFMARPARLPQLVGSFAAIWDDILPPLPEPLWRANLDAVAAALRASSPA